MQEWAKDAVGVFASVVYVVLIIGGVVFTIVLGGVLAVRFISWVAL